MESKQESLRTIPSVDQVLRDPRVEEILKKHPRQLVLETIRELLSLSRREVMAGGKAPILEEIIVRTVNKSRVGFLHSLRSVVNATGVILHTNLGRSVLGPSALKAMQEVAGHYSNLELDLESGRRGSRYAPLEGLLTTLTGAEAAMVVNNNAAAVLLVLTALARGKEVVVSRGELVEIGGGFRVPEVLEQSGAILVEVGTTNRTYGADYEKAITESTAAFLKVHPSNYMVSGFVHFPTVEELVQLGRKNNLPVFHDLGSGFLEPIPGLDHQGEPTVSESLRAGVDLVTFSGDKLLGGPQAGIILGRLQYIKALARHPLARALRVDKLTVAALAAVLRGYLDPEATLKEIPTLGFLTESVNARRRRAKRIAATLQRTMGNKAKITMEKTAAMVGGGSMPGVSQESWAVTVIPVNCTADHLAANLRQGTPAVLGRVSEDKLLLDVVTLLPGDEKKLLQALKNALAEEVHS